MPDLRLRLFWSRHSEKMSPSCLSNYEKILKITSVNLTEIKKGDTLPDLSGEAIVVDAIFGSGLTKPVTGFVAQVIDHINDSKSVVISVDVPSGFFCDATNTVNKGSIVKADYTLTFQFPKYGFLFAENDQYVGEWEVLPIGLHPDFIEKVKVKSHFLILADLRQIIKHRTKFSHKGTYGHGLLIAGSYGKMGAAVLAASAGIESWCRTDHCPYSQKGI